MLLIIKVSYVHVIEILDLCIREILVLLVCTFHFTFSISIIFYCTFHSFVQLKKVQLIHMQEIDFRTIYSTYKETIRCMVLKMKFYWARGLYLSINYKQLNKLHIEYEE